MNIIKKALTITILASILVLTLPMSTMANPGLQVTNAIIFTDVLPGDTVTHTMNVSISTNDSPMDISIEVGELEGVDKVYSASNFITVDKSAFHLEPGQSQDITAYINVPPDVGNGGKYANIFIKQMSSGSGVQIAVAVNVGVYLTIKGSELIHGGEITEIVTNPTTRSVSE